MVLGRVTYRRLATTGFGIIFLAFILGMPGSGWSVFAGSGHVTFGLANLRPNAPVYPRGVTRVPKESDSVLDDSYATKVGGANYLVSSFMSILIKSVFMFKIIFDS
jgi:hypothetical protein